jgi:uncharacterized protein (TIGR02597 family)
MAQIAGSDAVGGVNLTIKGGSDSVLAMPLARSAAFSGKVSARAPAGTNAFTVNVAVATDWTVDQFKALYYVRFTSGVRNGMYYTITANTASQLKLDTAGDDLIGVAVNDTFQVLPHWTLGTLFPPTATGPSGNPLTASTDLTPAGRKSEILFPNMTAAGINLPIGSRYFFTSAGWVADKAGNPVADDTILPPDCLFIVRQPVGVADVPWLVLGQAVTANVVVPLATRAGGKQDNPVGLIRPLPVRLIDAGLQSGFVDSLGIAGFQRRDVLLVFDNSVASYNKSASKSYIRVGGSWFADGKGQPVANDDLLVPGAGIVIRKYKNASGASTRWTNVAGYPAQ